jgi:hypothetical protein
MNDIDYARIAPRCRGSQRPEHLNSRISPGGYMETPRMIDLSPMKVALKRKFDPAHLF